MKASFSFVFIAVYCLCMWGGGRTGEGRCVYLSNEELNNGMYR